MNVDKIVKLLGETQLKYRRLHFDDYTRELAPRPATISTRIQLPSFLKSLVNEAVNMTVHSVSGQKFSIWHCLLYALYPDYITLSWYERKDLVDRFIDELNHDIESYFTKDPIIQRTTMDLSEVKLHCKIPSDPLMYYICSKFNINLVVCDTTRLWFYFKDTDFDRTLPTIMLYRDDRPTYHVILVDDQVITVNKAYMVGLYETAPVCNRILKEYTKLTPPKQAPKAPKASKASKASKAQKEFYADVNKLDSEQRIELDTKPKLNGMKLAELQLLAEKCKISIEKQGKTKMIKKLKKELVVDILEYFKNLESS